MAIKEGIERKLIQEQEALEYEFRIEKAKQEAYSLSKDLGLDKAQQRKVAENYYSYYLNTETELSEKKLKVAGQPKIDLKQFGEGKDLNYELQIDCLPNVELKSLNKFNANEYKIKIVKDVII